MLEIKRLQQPLQLGNTLDGRAGAIPDVGMIEADACYKGLFGTEIALPPSPAPAWCELGWRGGDFRRGRSELLMLLASPLGQTLPRSRLACMPPCTLPWPAGAIG